jgi:ankyrin repeat protein
MVSEGLLCDAGMLGWTCLHAAVRRKQRALAGLLLKKGADPNLEAQDGLSVMAFVLQNQRRQG